MTEMINGKPYSSTHMAYLRYSKIFVCYHRSSISEINQFVCLYNYVQKILVFFTIDEIYDKVQLRKEIDDYLNYYDFPILANDSIYKVVQINQLLNMLGFNDEALVEFRIKTKNNKIDMLFKIRKCDLGVYSYYSFIVPINTSFLESFIDEFKKITSNLIEFKKSNSQIALDLLQNITTFDITTIPIPNFKTDDFNKLITLNNKLNIKKINTSNDKIPDEITNYTSSIFSFITSLDPTKYQKTRSESGTYFKLIYSGLLIEIKYNTITLPKIKIRNYIHIKIPGFSNLILSEKMLASFLNLIDSKSRDLLINKLEIFKLKNI